MSDNSFADELGLFYKLNMGYEVSALNYVW